MRSYKVCCDKNGFRKSALVLYYSDSLSFQLESLSASQIKTLSITSSSRHWKLPSVLTCHCKYIQGKRDVVHQSSVITNLHYNTFTCLDDWLMCSCFW